MHTTAEEFDRAVLGLVVAHFGALLPGLAAFLATHFFDGLSFGGAFASLDGLVGITELTTGKEAIGLAGTIDLAFDPYAGRDVTDVDAVIGLIDFLPSTTASANKLLEDIVFTDAELGHALAERVEFFTSYHLGIMSEGA